MMLTKGDHIYVGIGHIYGPPFIARVLLYRLFDCNCAALIYHLQGSHVSAVHTFGKIQAMTASGGQKPTQLRAHLSLTSASMGLTDLLALPATPLELPEEGSTIHSFGDLAMRLEKFALRFTEKLILASEPLPLCQLGISGSAYHVTGRIDVSLWPEKVQAVNRKRQCWRLSLLNKKDNVNYDLESASDWSLTALDIEMQDGFQPAHEVILHKAAGHLKKG